VCQGQTENSGGFGCSYRRLKKEAQLSSQRGNSRLSGLLPRGRSCLCWGHALLLITTVNLKRNPVTETPKGHLPHTGVMMGGKTSTIAAGVCGALFVGYCIYFDRQRRNDPNFKNRLRERRRKQKQAKDKAGLSKLPDLKDSEAVQKFFLDPARRGAAGTGGLREGRGPPDQRHRRVRPAPAAAPGAAADPAPARLPDASHKTTDHQPAHRQRAEHG
ncbi:hypothetical protein AAFF_G00075850, partial [Aldrovandia affinis]